MRRAAFEKDLPAACARMHGTDNGLAAHFAVTRAAGGALWGKAHALWHYALRHTARRI